MKKKGVNRMKAITNAKAGKNILKKLFAMLALVTLVFSILQIGNSLASEETFSVTGVDVVAKADTVTVNELTFDNNTVRSNVTMRKVGDNITYKIVLKNNQDKNYTLKSISDDNQNDFISYKYDNYAGTKINAKESHAFNITAIYSKEQTDTSKRNVNFSVRFILNFEDEEGNEEQEVIDVNPDDNKEEPQKPSKIDEVIEKVKSPQTGDNVGAYIIVAIVSLIVLILTFSKREASVRVHKSNINKNKALKTQKVQKAQKANQKESKGKYILFSKSGKHSGKGFKFFVMILAIALMFPSISKANVDTVSIIFENNIQLMSTLVVKVDTDGDGTPEELPVKYNEPIGEIPNPEKDGYDFDGWEDENGDEFDPEITPVTDDITITPKFTPKKYSISYNLNEGNLADGKTNPVEYTIESETVTLNNPEKDGYTFTGWSGTGLTGDNNTTVTIAKGSTGNREFTAHYGVQTYTVTLDLQGGEGETTITREYEEPLGTIPTPTKDGYDFQGWYTEPEGGEQVTEDTPVTGPMEIHAKWQVIEYTVTYNGLTDEEINALGNKSTYIIEDEFTLTNPEREGYTFKGWSGTDLTGDNNQEVKIAKGSMGNREYTANFEAINYTITYIDVPQDEMEYYNYPTSYTIEDYVYYYNPHKTGYGFSGWTGTGLQRATFELIIPQGSTGNKEFTATFTPVNYTITYTGLTQEEASALNNPTAYTIESADITLAEPGPRYDNDGDLDYTFVGWKEGTTTSTNVVIPTGTIGDKEFEAIWVKAAPDTYTITYDLQGGAVETANPVSYTKTDATFTLNNPTKTGYDFVGWTGSNGDTPNPEVRIEIGTRGNLNFTAVWSPTNYAIEYLEVGYTGPIQEIMTTVNNPLNYTIESDEITLIAPTPEGFDFTGWSGTGLNGENNLAVTIPTGSIGNRTYTAHYQIQEYTITLDVNGGNPLDNNEVKRNYGDTLGDLPTPTRTGYRFTGWSNKNPSYGVDSNTVVIGDADLEANWEEIDYWIYFYSNYEGDARYNSVHLSYNQFVNFEDYSFTRDGYSQTKWTTNADGTGTEYYVMSSGNQFTSVDGDRIDLYAQWQGNQYTIYYQYNVDMSHHIFSGPTMPTTYTPEDCPITIQNASATGFTFDGWALTQYGSHYTTFELPAGTWGDQTLYGFFTPIDYNITYDYDGGSIPNGGSNPGTYTVEDTVYLTEPVKEGHTFQGWSVVNHDQIGWVEYINGNLYAEDITVVAHYTTNTYSISFESNGGTQYPSRNIEYGRPVGALETPERPGYRFLGWYSDEYFMYPVDGTELCSGDATYYANWQIIEYTISYEGITDDELNGITAPRSYTVESDTIYIGNPQSRYDADGDEYERFKGWQVNDDSINLTTYASIYHGSTGNITFTARWDEVDPPLYHITYNTHEFATILQNPEYYTKKTPTFTLNNAEATGYDFGGWSGTGLIGNANKVVTIEQGTRGDLEFELHMIPHTYYIRFDANGGEGEEITEQYTWNLNGYLPANPYTREGYTFAGWNEAQDGSSLLHQPGDNVLSITPEQDAVVVYYATWTPNNYTISFNANSNGVTGSMYDQQATYDMAVRLYKNMFEKLGFKFDSWNTDATGNGTRYEDEEEVSNLVAQGTAMLYAQWAVTPYTIIFDKNDPNATGSMGSMSVPYGEAVNLNPITYTYTDHKLKEWNTKADGTGTGYSDEEEVVNLDIDGEVTLYAQWREIESTFDTGTKVRVKMAALANDDLTNITAVKPYNGTPDISGFTDDNIVSTSTSPDPIYAWFDNGTMYYWSEDTHPAINADAGTMFSGFSAATEIDIKNVDTTNMVYMRNMFSNCSSLTELDLSNNSFANVKDMYCTFYGASNLETLKLGSDNEATQIGTMQSTFAGCSKLTNLEVNVKIDKVTNMDSTFRGCGIVSVDFSNFDTSNVTNMSEMFRGCGKLEEVNFGDTFNTANVNRMVGMFRECRGLTELDLSGFSSENLTSITEMFRDSNKIEHITFGPDFTAKKIGSLYYVFSGCSKLQELDLSNFETDSLTDMRGTFCQCGSMTDITFSNKFNTSQVTNMNSTFERCGSLTELDLSSFDFSSVNNINYMFGYCGRLERIIGNFESESVQNMAYTFYNCQNLLEMDLSKLGLENVTTMAEAFSYCYVIKDIQFKQDTTTSNLTNLFAMYRACGELTELDMSMFDTTNIGRADVMFSGCGKLKTIYATDKFTLVDKDFNDAVFTGCGSLVGGAGTRISAEHVDKSYGHIDGGTSNPGYFTDKTKLNIFYYPNGENVTGTMTNQTTQANTDIQLNDNQYVNLGYAFGGWNTEADGSGAHYDNGQVVNGYGSLFLYAQWGLTPYTVVFDKNADDATGSMENIQKAYGEHFNLPAGTYSREGYVFKGWNSKADGTGRHYDDEQEVINLDIDGEVTLYAEWFEISATFNQGPYVNDKIKALIAETPDDAQISIRKTSVKPNMDDMTNANIISAPNSNFPIYMWLDGDNLYWWSEAEKAKLHSNSGNMFAGLRKVVSIDTENIIANNAREMRTMFSGCGVTTLDLSSWDTSNVTTMQNMFTGSKIESINLGGQFNTENVTNMSQIFYKCSELQSIDLSNLNTGKVTQMDSFFQECTNLESIHFGDDFDTSKVINMDRMFQGASKLQEIDLTSFNTEELTRMFCMFYGCTSVTNIEFGEDFTAEKVTTMEMAFYGCRALTSIDFSTFNTANLQTLRQTFQGCANLESINFGDHFNTDKVTSMYFTFYQCGKIEELDLSKFDSSSLTSTTVLFQDCTSLRSVTFGPNFKASSVTNMSQMFQNCRSLESLDLSMFEPTAAINLTAMFRACPNLESIDFGDKFYVRNATTFDEMFNGCSSLKSLDLSSFNPVSATSMRAMFSNCSALESIDLGDNFDTSNVQNFSSMFSVCRKLTNLKLGSAFTAKNATSTYAMFDHCDIIEVLDLGDAFETNKITNAYAMFQNCPKLETIYVTGFDTSHIEDSANMFYPDSSLVGGMGTTYHVTHIDHDYAHIDGGPDNPGYFTSKTGSGQNNTNSTNSVNPGTLNAPLNTNMVAPNSMNGRALNITLDKKQVEDDDTIADDDSKDAIDTEESNELDEKDNTQEEDSKDNSDTNVDELEDDITNDIQDTEDEAVSNNETEEVTNEEVPEQGTEETKED